MFKRQLIFRLFGLLLAAFFVSTCGRTSPPPKEDFTPPTVVTTAPNDGSTGVGVTTSISLVFSEDMDESSVNTSTFQVNDPNEGPIPGVVTCVGKNATFRPLANLKFSTTYVVALSTAVRDKSLNLMYQSYNFVFTTGEYVDTIPPHVFTTLPTGTNAGVNAVIVVTFNESMDPFSFTPQSIVVSKSGGTVVTGELTVGDLTAIFQPDKLLDKLTKYDVVVDGSVQDISGNPMGQPYSWSFTTKDPDDERPWVISTYPTASASNVAVTATISVAFNEAMLVSSITPSSMVLTEQTIYGTEIIAGSIFASGATANLTPLTKLKYNTDYVVTLVPGWGGPTSGITDLAGNPLTENSSSGWTWAFRTTASPIYVINATYGQNGTISPSGNVSVAEQQTQTFTVTPSPGYVAVMGGTCGGILDGNIYTTSPITGNCTVTASFTQNAYTVTATAGANGTISPASQLVGYGGTTTFTVTPSTGYTAAVGGTCGGTLVGTTYTTNPITAACTVSATFTLNRYTVTATAGANGTISPASRQVNHGSTTTFTVTPSNGYTAVMGGTCGGTLVGTTYTTSAITAACTVSATFTLTSYTVTATAGTGGTISPPSVNVNHGSTTAFTVTPNTGYAIGTVGGTCGGSLAGNIYTTNAITAACTVSASFVLTNYTVTATAGANGTISPASRLVSYGSTTTFTVTPSGGYTAIMGGTCGGTLNGTTYTTAPIIANCTITASFTLNAFTVTATAGPNGTISPASRLVGYGDTTVFTVTPSNGYTAVMGGTCGGTLNGSTYTTNPIIADCTVAATFTLNSYTVTATAGTGGTISPASRLVSHGSTTTFTVTPSTGYTATVSGTCGGTLVGTTYTTNPITAPCSVSATFALNSYTVTATAGTGGTISPSGDVAVSHSNKQAFTITQNPGYSIGPVGGTCGGTLVGTTYTTNPITAPCTVIATFTLNSYTVTATAGPNGTISPASRLVSYGSTTTFTVTPSTGYTATVGGTCGGTLVGTTYTTNAITAPCTVDAAFTLTSYTVTATAGTGGTISPPSVNVNHGSTTTFTVTPTTGYSIGTVGGTCGGSLAGNIYTTNAITTPCTVTASFVLTNYTVTATAGANGTISPASRLVSYGSTTTFTVTPNAGYSAVVGGTCGGSLDGTTYTTAPIIANCSVTASFTLNAFTVTATAGPNGTISPASRVVGYNSTTAFTVSANTGYSAVMGGTCGGTLVGNTYETNPIIADCTVTATFTLNSYTVTATAGTGGTISPASNLVSHGSTTTFTITPNTGYSIGPVGGTCGGSLAGNVYTTNPITASCTVSAVFTLNSYSVTPSSGANGIISPATPQTVNHGSTTTFTVTPNTGYFAVVGGTCGGTLVGTTYTTNPITAPCTVAATFTPNSYTVSTSAGSGGSISPTSAIVSYGSTTTFTIIPNGAHNIGTVTGCGGSLNGNIYTTGPITGACTVSATFPLKSYVVSTLVSSGLGTFNPPTATVDDGSTTSFTVTPSTGYSIGSVTGCGGNLVGNTFTTGPITAACTVTATFTLNSYTVSTLVSSGLGSFNPPSATVNYNLTTTLAVSADLLYYITSINGCGGPNITNTDPTFTTYNYVTGPITANCTVIASYDIAPAAPIGATQGIGFGSLGAMSFLLNHRIFGNLFRRRRKQHGSRGNHPREDGHNS